MSIVSEDKMSYNIRILEHMLVHQAKEYLHKQIHESLKDDIHEIATNAVKQWAEFRFSESPSEFGYNTNINVAFIEKVIKTEMRDHPISIHVKEKQNG